MKYSEIVNAKADIERRRKQNKLNRQAQIYREIWSDVAAIIKYVVPEDKCLRVSNHLKSIMYGLIELKTGKRPDKI
jgi:hypothetical protein